MTVVRRIQWACYLKTWPWNISDTLTRWHQSPWQTARRIHRDDRHSPQRPETERTAT